MHHCRVLFAPVSEFDHLQCPRVRRAFGSSYCCRALEGRLVGVGGAVATEVGYESCLGGNPPGNKCRLLRCVVSLIKLNWHVLGEMKQQ